MRASFKWVLDNGQGMPSEDAYEDMWLLGIGDEDSERDGMSDSDRFLCLPRMKACRNMLYVSHFEPLRGLGAVCKGKPRIPSMSGRLDKR